MKKLLLTFLIAFITALGLNAKTATLTLDGYSERGTIISSLSLANGDIKISVTKNSDGNGVKYYPANKNEEAAFRLYANASMKFTCNNTNEKITKIEFTMSTSNGTWSNPTSTPTGFNSKTSIWESTDGAQEVTIKNGGTSQARFTKVVITYGGGSGEEKPVLGPIMMGSTPVSTEEAYPTTAIVKGGGTISFTSENAASMIVYQDGVQNVSTGESPITWTAPEATDSEQTFSLQVVSQLKNDGEELQKKTAYLTVTVEKRPDPSDDFVLITDANDLSTEYTYILYGCNDSRGKQALMKSSVSSGYFAANQNQSTFNISDDFSSIQIDEANTETAIITLEESTNSGKYYLKIGNKYISVSGTDASLSTTKTEFTITFDTKNRAELKVGSNYLGYNASTPRFKPYNGNANRLGSIYLYAKKTMTPVEPGEVTSEPAAVEGVITINKDEEITFSSKDAAKLQVSTQSEPVVGSSYKYTPTEEGEVTITPIDSEGKVYTEKAATFTIKFFPEAPTFTPDGGDVNLFSTVKIACATEGATLTYKIGDGEATAYPADGIKMTEAGEVTITAIATKNGLSTETTKTFNVTDKREEVYVMFDANKYEFTVGEEFESPVAKAYTYNNEDFVEIPDFTETINYESDNTSVAEVNATTGELTLKAAGTCKITASLKSETYKSDPDHYTLTVNKGLVDGLIEYPVSEFVYTIGSGEQLPVLYKYPDNVDVEYSISHKRVENGVAVYNPATIDEQGNITVNTPGIVTVTATVKADRSKTASYVLEIQSLKEAETSASTVKAPVVHITGGNVYYSPDGEWYWGTEDENHVLSFANETDGAQIYYTMTSATPSSANVRAMANSATRTLYSTPFKKSDLDGNKITFWAEKDDQKSAVETLNFNIKTGIEDIDVENGEAIEEEGDARYFNLQGLEVKNPGEGIYIRVANGKATKILKK